MSLIKLKLIVIGIILIQNSGIFADYSSLTLEEKEKITIALQQSKFYKYYEALVDGNDTITVLNIIETDAKIENKNLKRIIYRAEILLNISDQKFKRIFDFEVTHQLITGTPDNFWNSDIGKGLSIAGWIGTGILSCAIVFFTSNDK